MGTPRLVAGVVLADPGHLSSGALVPVVGLRSAGVDVLVVDDLPDSGLVGPNRLEVEGLGARYYRSPRPLGATRCLNLVLLLARSEGYDAVVLVSPGVTVPANVATLFEAGQRPWVASVTAWAERGAPDQLDQETVDWISSQLEREDGLVAVEVPSCSGPCVLLTATALREVGVFDPLFRSPEAAMIDWSMRAVALGLSSVVSPSVFVSDPAHVPTATPDDRLFVFRHPSASNRADILAGAGTGEVERMSKQVGAAVVLAAARRLGYTIDVARTPGPPPADEVQVTVLPDGEEPVVTGHFRAFSATLSLPPEQGVAEGIRSLVGTGPRAVTVSDDGPFAEEVARAEWDSASRVSPEASYPRRV